MGHKNCTQMKAGPTLERHIKDFCYGAQWSSHRKCFLARGGQPESYGTGEDTIWAIQMFRKFGVSGDPITPDMPPSYVYSRLQSNSWHSSELGRGMAYKDALAKMPKQSRDDFVIELPAGYSQWTKDKIPTEVQRRAW
jgi:hypothetical protein